MKIAAAKNTRANPPHLPALVLLAAAGLLLMLLPASAQQTAMNRGADLVWPLPPDKPRIRYIESFSNNFDLEPRKKRSWADRVLGKPDPNVTELFQKPSGVATDSRGRIYIAASQVGTVYVLDKKKKEVLRLRGDRGVALRTPLGLVVDAKDNLFVADPVLRAVMKFDPEGRMVATIGTDVGIKNPTYMAIDEARRRLYVVDSHLHQVLVFHLDSYQLIRRVGQRGENDGEFNYPVGIGVGPDGTFAVTDTGSCSVQLFSKDFKFIRRFGRQGVQPGNFVRPKGVAFDAEGHIYVVDAAFNNFQIFDKEGHILMFVGAFGQVPGAFNLPNGIHIDEHNRVYVTDQLNHRVQVFQFLGGK